MTEFKVGDRVRLVSNEGMAAAVDATATVVNKPDLTQYLYVKWHDAIDVGKRNGQCNGGYDPGKFELVERPWEFEVGKYYRNIKNPDHIVRVANTITGIRGITVQITVVQSRGCRIGSTFWYLDTNLKEILEPCSAPKAVVKKSGWIISCIGKNSNNGLKSVINTIYSTQEEAVTATHSSWKKVAYHQIEWEEEIVHAETFDDDMV